MRDPAVRRDAVKVLRGISNRYTLDAAERLLVERSPLNMAALASAAGVSRPTLYAHFKTIADVLALAGANETVLLFQEQAVMAATRSRANRLANADHANLVRTSRAAHDQLRAVDRLRKSGELQRLPDRLQEIAELRERHPTLSLHDLASKCRPPVTKAAVHRRLRKLQELAAI